jgi:hypothetical protein
MADSGYEYTARRDDTGLVVSHQVGYEQNKVANCFGVATCVYCGSQRDGLVDLDQVDVVHQNDEKAKRVKCPFVFGNNP